MGCMKLHIDRRRIYCYIGTLTFLYIVIGFTHLLISPCILLWTIIVKKLFMKIKAKNANRLLFLRLTGFYTRLNYISTASSVVSQSPGRGKEINSVLLPSLTLDL